MEARVFFEVNLAFINRFKNGPTFKILNLSVLFVAHIWKD